MAYNIDVRETNLTQNPMILYINTDEAPDAEPDPIDVREAVNARFEFEQWKKEQIRIIEDYLQLPRSSDDDSEEAQSYERRLYFLKDTVRFEHKLPFLLKDEGFREWYNDEYLVEYEKVKWYLLE